MEYQNLHQRVDQHVETGRQNTLQALIILGAIIIFSINCFHDATLRIFVNLAMCAVFPVVAFNLVASMVAINVKICAYGEYIATIEQRINQILHYSTAPSADADEKIVDWERWRRAYGIAKEKPIFYDGLLLYIAIIIGAFLSAVIRLMYLNESFDPYLRFWVLTTPLLFAFFLTVIVELLQKLRKRALRVDNVLASEKITYGTIPRKDLKGQTHRAFGKGVFKSCAIFGGFYIGCIMLLFAFIPFSFHVQSDATSWISHAIIAHRGLHTEAYPENTLPAFSNAISHDYPIELDVWVSKDKVPVVIHDKNVSRLCQVDQNITDMSLEEIRQLAVMGKEKVPTLQETLQLIGGRVPVIVEIKAYFPSKIEMQAIADTLSQYDGLYVVQSFSPFPLNWLKHHNSDIPRGQLYADWGVFNAKWILRLRDNLFSLVSAPNCIGYDRSILPYESLSQMRQNGIPVLGWLYKVNYKDEVDAVEPAIDGYVIEIG